MSKKLSIKDCRMPWGCIQILTTGDVRVCCWANHPVGNLNLQSLEEIWNGDKVKSLRESIEKEEVSSHCIGAACPYIQTLTTW